MPVGLQPWELVQAGGQFEGRQPGSLCWWQLGRSQTVGGKGSAGGRLQAEDPRPPTSRTSGDRRQQISAVPTNILIWTQFKQFQQRRDG